MDRFLALYFTENGLDSIITAAYITRENSHIGESSRMKTFAYRWIFWLRKAKGPVPLDLVPPGQLRLDFR